MSTNIRYRPMKFGVTRGVLREGADGVRYLRAEVPLEGYAKRMTDRLVHWAETAPDRVFMARRGASSRSRPTPSCRTRTPTCTRPGGSSRTRG